VWSAPRWRWCWASRLFGGIGQNLFNPAMVARVALLISFRWR
jgi:Na+-translocating ferredoxin:NAD+ oxidoreductase RnfD subunit